MKNKNLPMDEMYVQMGRDAFAAGLPRRPVSDKELMADDCVGNGYSAPFFALWLRGWDAANMEAPVDDEIGKCLCPQCGKLVDPEWHDHCDEAGQTDEMGE